MEKYDVQVFWDDEAQAWVAVCNEIPFTLFANTIELLMKDVRETTPEVLELNGVPCVNPMLAFHIEERLEQAI